MLFIFQIDQVLDLEVADALINQSLTAEYTAKHFHGLFWWNDSIDFMH